MYRLYGVWSLRAQCIGIMQVEREIIFFKTNFGNETICFCKNQLQGMKMEVFEEWNIIVLFRFKIAQIKAQRYLRSES